MSDIVLSASVRQNLLSLQSTAQLLSTTQNRLATGNKVNSALDNPTNYFTAQALNNRASDINNLLDGIGNGVQVLQAANTGITSLQKLVDSAKSVANQALQATGGYSAKSSVAATITGATAVNLLAPTASDATFTVATDCNRQLAAAPTDNSAVGSVAIQNEAPAAITASTSLNVAAASDYLDLTATCTKLSVNGVDITFDKTAAGDFGRRDERLHHRC